MNKAPEIISYYAMRRAVGVLGISLPLILIGGTFILAIRTLKDGFFGQERKLKAEEARMIQEIYRGISRMEERIEVLEYPKLTDAGYG